MGWKFWQNDKKNASTIKLHTPKDIPEQIGRHLVVHDKMDPDLVWTLKCAFKPHLQNRTVSDFRVFSTKSVQTSGVEVVNYDSLDAHPELIISQGSFDKRENKITIHNRG